MSRVDYRSAPVRSASSAGSLPATELVIPLILVVVGLRVFGIWGYSSFGARGAMVAMGLVFVIAAVLTVLGVASAFITAAIMSTSFGELRTAFLKFAGIILLTSGLAALIPYGGLIVLAIYLGLLVWLFGVEMKEALSLPSSSPSFAGSRCTPSAPYSRQCDVKRWRLGWCLTGLG